MSESEVVVPDATHTRSRGGHARRRGWPRRLLRVGALVPLWASLLAGQGNESSSVGTRLGALYEVAARENPRILAATALAEAARARVPGASRPPDPNVQLGLMNRSLPGLGPMNPLGMTQVQVTQMLPTAGKLGLAASAADARSSGARARAADLRWEVRAAVATAFYDVYTAERAIGIALTTRSLMEDIAQTADAMYRVGEASQADVLKARVEVARMTEEIVAMRAMRLVALSRLSGLLDEPMDSATAPMLLPQFPPDLPSLDSLVVVAAETRPMIRGGQADLRAAEADETRARREIWPDVEVGLQYGQRGGVGGPERMASLMLGASVPVFARDRQLRMRDESAAMRAMAAADLAAMRAETRARVGEAYAQWQRARNLQALYRTTVLPQSRAAVTAALAAYRVGTVNLMTLLDNQAIVNRYAQELAALEAAEGMALSDLEMLLGRELMDSNTGRLAPGGEG